MVREGNLQKVTLPLNYDCTLRTNFTVRTIIDQHESCQHHSLEFTFKFPIFPLQAIGWFTWKIPHHYQLIYYNFKAPHTHEPGNYPYTTACSYFLLNNILTLLSKRTFRLCNYIRLTLAQSLWCRYKCPRLALGSIAHTHMANLSAEKGEFAEIL